MATAASGTNAVALRQFCHGLLPGAYFWQGLPIQTVGHRMTVSEHYKAHVDLLEAMSDAGDEVAARSLACLALVVAGWRYGDPDPIDGPPDDDGGGESVLSNVVPFRLAA